MSIDMGAASAADDQNGWACFRSYSLLPPGLSAAGFQLVNGEDAASIAHYQERAELAREVQATLPDGRPAGPPPTMPRRVWAKWW